MKRALIMLLAAAAPALALAQPTNPHTDHAAPAPTKPAADPHAAQETEKPVPAQTSDPHAVHEAPPVTPLQADPHAGHRMADEPPAPPVAPPSAAALSGPDNAADLVYGSKAMADAREQLRAEHGDITAHKILLDRMEVKIQDGRDGYAWDGEAWYGGDIDRLWLKSEGEGSFCDSPESAEVQALWSHAMDPWFNFQAGVRYDFQPNPERGHLVLGIQGLAPYWFEVDGALFLSHKGDLTARFEAEYDQRITQKLILQPRFEFELAAQDVPELGIGSGLSSAEAGLRLRYEILPEFAPYIGVQYERAFGGTADFHREAGEDVGGWSFLVGLRTWF